MNTEQLTAVCFGLMSIIVGGWTFFLCRRGDQRNREAVKLLNESLERIVAADGRIFDGQIEAMKDLVSVVVHNPNRFYEQAMTQLIAALESICRDRERSGYSYQQAVEDAKLTEQVVPSQDVEN